MRITGGLPLRFVFVALVGVFSIFDLRAADDMRVMSFNISCDYGADGENNWEFRRETLLDVIREDDPDLLGVQEAVPGQMDDLNASLSGYRSFGVGRDDGVRAGEHMAIFYKKDAFDLLDWGTFWLSETPDKPGKGWDAMCCRSVTWGKFRRKESGETFCFANTHLDHVGTTARAESAKLILRRLSRIAGKDEPFFISGDFNVSDKDGVYATMTKGIDDVPGLYDSNKIAKEREIAQEYTFHNWDQVDPKDGSVIDYIFVNDKVDVKKFKIDPVRHSDGRFASDHVSIVATISFR